MKKKYIIITLSILLILTTCLYVFMGDNTKRIVISNEESKKLTNNNTLTMMYEIEAGSGEYQVTSDNVWPQEGYVFNEQLSACENGSELTWDDENKRVIMEANTSDKCYVYFDVYVPPKITDICISGANLASCIKEFNSIAGDSAEGLYYHDGVGTYGTLEAGDNSYRFAGANPNNYVCFGSDEATCPADNLYRIIGVFDEQVKLIKYDYAGEITLGTAPASDGTPDASYYKGSLSSIPFYYWSGSSSNRSNTWSSSTLNTDILNGTYLNTLGSKWSSLIATTSWKVGGMSSSSTNTAKQYYTTELGSSSSSTTYSAKIGLMYVSEYGYATSPENWNTALYDYDNDTNRNNNWLYMGAPEWTISRSSDGSNGVFVVDGVGGVVYGYVFFRDGVRPSFSLESSVVLSGGSGSSADPYRLA